MRFRIRASLAAIGALVLGAVLSGCIVVDRGGHGGHGGSRGQGGYASRSNDSGHHHHHHHHR